jgi:hypothetical protein
MSKQRRDFLSRAGKIAITTPPALVLLLKAEGRHYALALSGTSGNPGNNKPVGHAGDFPRGQGPGGTGDRGNSR